MTEITIASAQHKFPAGLEDCLAAVRWIAAEGGQWGIDPARLALGGDSAGGNLALATLLSLRDAGASPLRAGLLIYGAYLPYTAETETASQAAYGDGRTSSRRPRCAGSGATTSPARPTTGTRSPCRSWPSWAAGRRDGHRRRVRSLARRQHPARRQARGGGRAAPLRAVAGVTHAYIHMTRMLDVAQTYMAEMAAWVRSQLQA